MPADPAAALDRLLDARAAAIRDGDRDAWLAGLDPVPGTDAATGARAERFRRAQEALFDRVRSLRPASWSYQVAGGYALPAARRVALGGTGWLADVELDYRLAAGGPLVQRQQFLTVVPEGTGWRIADDTDGATGRDVWDLGPITHQASARCLVVGASARRAQVAQLARECGRSAGTVDGAWGRSWPRRTVLTVPGTLTQLAVLLGRTTDASDGTGGTGSGGAGAGGTGAGGGSGAVDTAGLAETAAVTIGPADGAASGVLINGAAFDELSATGRRVVLTHELVHVATRATGSASAPVWLAEGYADHVAYAGSGLSARQVAGEALDAVRAGRVPGVLPAPDDFDAAGDGAATAYGLSWVAVGVIAGRAGSAPKLKAFYQRAAAPGTGSLGAALAGVGLGGTPALVGVWQARLRQLAAG